MKVDWTRHRFSGGVLALNVVNTVVHRCDPVRAFDRFEDANEIPRFAEAASRFCATELSGRALQARDGAAIRPVVLAMREATDGLFRASTGRAGLAAERIPGFLKACADGLEGFTGSVGGAKPFGDPSTPIAFPAALSISALSLMSAGRFERVKVCPNCDWLFLDASRNASRLWCDMTVCGNRAKARRHYRRKTAKGVVA